MATKPKKSNPQLNPPAIKRLRGLKDSRKTVPELLKSVTQPSTILDRDLVIKMASCDCTVHEMAMVMKTTTEVIYQNYGDALQEGRSQGNYSLKFRAFEKAMAGDTTLLIFLLKNRAYTFEGERYRDKLPDQVANNTINIMIAEVPK